MSGNQKLRNRTFVLSRTRHHRYQYRELAECRCGASCCLEKEAGINNNQISFCAAGFLNTGTVLHASPYIILLATGINFLVIAV